MLLISVCWKNCLGLPIKCQNVHTALPLTPPEQSLSLEVPQLAILLYLLQEVLPLSGLPVGFLLLGPDQLAIVKQLPVQLLLHLLRLLAHQMVHHQLLFLLFKVLRLLVLGLLDPQLPLAPSARHLLAELRRDPHLRTAHELHAHLVVLRNRSQLL